VRAGNGRNGECTAIAHSRMPSCPAVDSGKYVVSSTGKRLVHADTCTNVNNILPDTDGKARAAIVWSCAE
jgi:hypothetical protein